MTWLTSSPSQKLGLLILRVSLAGLIFWWGLVKGLNTGTGVNVSNAFYGGVFSVELLLIAFGWAQVVLAILVAIGLFRTITLPVMFVINAFVAAAVWYSILDPFWLFASGEKPPTHNALFYPSLIVAAGCWVIMACRDSDTYALDAKRG
ncbi:MAG: hypothetical protein AAFN27_13335 [Pseudomonadota bacterium]